MTTPDYRALAAELLKAFDTASAVLVGEGLWDDDDTDPGYSLRSRARAALAAEPEPPTAGEVVELVNHLFKVAAEDESDGCTYDSAFTRRAAELLERLDEPGVVEPTDEELEKLADDYMAMDGATGIMCLGHIDFARAVLARWGQS